MDILFLLIPLSVVLVLLIGAVFWLALKGGQFEDLESPGLKVLLDDDTPAPAPAPTQAAADVVTGKGEEGNRRD